MIKKIIFSVVLFLLCINSFSQDTLIQVWGMLKTDSTDEPIESAIIRNKNTNMVTTSKAGVFSIVARAGDKLIVSRLGFQPIHITIPLAYKGSQYEIEQTMKIDRVELPNIKVKTYPTAEELKREFLNQPNDLNDPIIQAQKGYDKKSIDEYLKTISTDAKQSTNNAMKSQQRTGIGLFQKKKKKEVPAY